MSRFSSSLGTRPLAIRLASDHASNVWTLRIRCAEAWDAVRVELVPDTRVRDVKQAAMAELMADVDDLDGYVVKLHGCEVIDENASVQSAGAVDGSTLLIIARRKRAVR